jgi:hypothetical protein
MSGLRESRRTDAVSSIGAMQISIVFSIFPQTFTQDVRKCLRESQPTLSEFAVHRFFFNVSRRAWIEAYKLHFVLKAAK